MKRAISLLLALIVLLAMAAPVLGNEKENNGKKPVRGSGVWTVAMVVYRSTDAVCNGNPVQFTLSDFEYSRAINAAHYFDQQVSQKSNGRGDIALTIIERPVLTSVSSAGSYCWVTPADVAASGGWPQGFDSVHVQHDARGIHPYFGLAYACGGGCSYGSTYSTSMVPSGGNWWFWNDTITDADVITHEWMHDANAWHRTQGRDVPDPHEDTNPDLRWSGDWNTALLSGSIVRLSTGQNVGWTRQTWQAGSPL